MLTNTRRKILRRYTTYPIVFGTRHSNTCHQGKMGDFSIRGMQFCSPVAIDPGNQVWIRTTPIDAQGNRGFLQDEIDAVVCWCEDHSDGDESPFSVGVVFCPGQTQPD